MLTNKRYYSAGQFYGFIRIALTQLPTLIRAERSELVSPSFREKIILAVTEVNGCDLCSQVHSAKALKAGMSESEIAEMLRADHSNIENSEGVAIMFAQHYADSAGQPQIDSLERLISTYGAEKARDILAFIRVIMTTNSHGNALFAMKQGLSGKTVKGTNLGTIMFEAIGFPLMIPVALIHNLFNNPLNC